MNQNTKVLLGLVAVAAVAYYLWEKSKKDAASDAVASNTPATPATPDLPRTTNPIVPIESMPMEQAPAPKTNMSGNFNAMKPIFADYAGDPQGFFSTEKVKLNY
jgi:hypothetical protein